MVAKVAVAQIDPILGQKLVNLQTHRNWLRRGAELGAELVVFPECSLTGYIYNRASEVEEIAETVPGKMVDELSLMCEELKIYCAVGMLEKDGGRVFNTAVLLGPNGLVGKYRKMHIPFLGGDRFVARGDIEPTVFDTPLGKIGLTICYDLRFPETTRVLALKGADLILHLTNLPGFSEAYVNFINRTRALENRCFLASSNRVGWERGVNFIGRSQIIDYNGVILQEGGEIPKILMADLPVAETREARRAKVIVTPGEFEFSIFEDRRPEMYDIICKPAC